MTIGRPRCARRSPRGSCAGTGSRALDPATQVLPVLGSREALFAFAQTVIDAQPRRRDRADAESVLPDLRRRGAARRRRAVLRQRRSPRAASRPRGARCPSRLGADAARVRLLARQSDRPRDDRRRVGVAVRDVGSPRLRDRGRRVLFGDLFRRGEAAGRRARRRAGAGPRRLSAPGRRSAACPSDRTRPACARATSPATRRCSRRSCSTGPITARRCRRPSRRRASPRGATRPTCARTAPNTRPSSRALQPKLAAVLPCAMPDAAFYLWARTPIDDAEFAKRLLAEQAVTVLPGSFLARDAHGVESRAGATSGSRSSPAATSAPRRSTAS